MKGKTKYKKPTKKEPLNRRLTELQIFFQDELWFLTEELQKSSSIANPQLLKIVTEETKLCLDKLLNQIR